MRRKKVIILIIIFFLFVVVISHSYFYPYSETYFLILILIDSVLLTLLVKPDYLKVTDGVSKVSVFTISPLSPSSRLFGTDFINCCSCTHALDKTTGGYGCRWHRGHGALQHR